MSSLNNDVREYTIQLSLGRIQRAYKGIMTFMTDLKAHLEGKFPDYIASALYLGYMDMTYFAFTPSILKDKKLKIAIVYLHKENKFELWLKVKIEKFRQIILIYSAILILEHILYHRFTLEWIQSSHLQLVSSQILKILKN